MEVAYKLALVTCASGRTDTSSDRLRPKMVRAPVMSECSAKASLLGEGQVSGRENLRS